MKIITKLMVVLFMATLLTSIAFAAMTPGINLLSGTTEPQTFDNLTSLPSGIHNAELSPSPFDGESGQVLHANYKNATYSTIHFKFEPDLDKDRPYRISFKVYKKADEGYGTESTQLWIMKNGTAAWQIAKNIGGLLPNNPNGWYKHDYVVSTFASLTNKDTGLIDTTDIDSIFIEWKYDSSSTCLVNENVYVDDVSIIPSYKFTYLDEDGTTTLKTSYENTTEKTFAPVVLMEDKNKGIIGWSIKNDGTVDETITLKNEDVTLYAVYDNSLRINLSADKTLLTSAGDKASLETNLWHRNGVNGVTVSYSVAEGSSYVTLKDNGDGTATVTAKAEGLAKILCTASTGEKEYVYILCNYSSVEMPTVTQTVPTISASEWLYDHTGATYDETEGAWKVIKRTDVVKSDDGNGNIVYYNNGFLSKQVGSGLDTNTYKYLLFRVKADKLTSFQVAVRVGSAYKYAYPSTSATNGEYVDLYANINDLALQAGSASIVQYVLGITNNQNGVVYIKDITLSNIPTYEPQIPEVKSVKVIKKVSVISDDAGTADVEAALFSNKSSDGSIAWKSSSDCITIKNLGNGKATLLAMGDGTATITAYADGDESVSESFTVTVSGQREKQAVYDIRILFWGASTTKHQPNASLGWYGDWGMAASAEENDYVHKLVSYLEKEFYPSKVTYEVIAASTLDVDLTSCTDATKDWTKHVQYIEIEDTIKELKPNIIVTAMTGNMGADTPVDVAYNAYKQFYDMMYSYNPETLIIAQHCGLSCKERNDKVIEKLDKDYSDKVFYDYHVNPTMKLDPANLAPEFEHTGVAAHWGDKGHNLVATTCFNYLKPEIPANIEAEYIYLPEEVEITGATKIDEKGASLQLGIDVTPNDASNDVVWSVDNSNLALISQNGLLTPLANGTVVVTAKCAYDEDVFDTHTVVLTNQLDNFTLTYAAGTTDTVTGLPAADDYASGEYTLSSIIPLRDAYTFVGWGLTENATETVTTVNVVKPTTVYAVWKKTESFEFEGSYDENNGFIYGFEVESGFHNNISNSYLSTVCTAGAKVTFKSPVIDIVGKKFVSVALISNYTDENGVLELTVKTENGNTTYVFPIATTEYTTYVADISSLTGAVTGVEIYVNTVTPDSSMFDISLDYVRFDAVRSVEGNFAVSDGKTYLSSASFAGYTEVASGAQDKETLYVSLSDGYTVKVKDASTVYAKATENGANIAVLVLGTNGSKFIQKSYSVYTCDAGVLSLSEALSGGVTSYDVSSLRIADPLGVRVKASVNADLYTEESVSQYGFVIAKLSTIENGEISDLVLDDEYVSGNKVVYGAAFDKVKNIHKVYETEENLEFFTAVLYNVPMTKQALLTPLVFRPYIKLSNGNLVYGAKIVRSVCDVAVDVYMSSSSDEDSKAKALEIATVCGVDFDKDVWLDGGELYK